MSDLLTGAVSGGRFAPDLRPAPDLGGTAGICFTVLAVDLGRLIEPEVYGERLAEFVANVRGSGDPGDDVMVPGEPELRRRRQADVQGVPVPQDVMQALEVLRAP